MRCEISFPRLDTKIVCFLRWLATLGDYMQYHNLKIISQMLWFVEALDISHLIWFHQTLYYVHIDYLYSLFLYKLYFIK